MAQVFVEVTAADGTKSYQPVEDWSEVEVPEAVVQASPLWVKTEEARKKAVKQAIDRRLLMKQQEQSNK